MCEDCTSPSESRLSRRSFLSMLSVAPVAYPLSKRAKAGPSTPTTLPLTRPSAATALDTDRYGVTVLGREEWGSRLRPVGELQPEPDVRFLLVHHSASSNDYERDAVPDVLRGFFRFHTGPDKRWPDVAYNFFVDRFGRVWEGRTGSRDRAVAGSATGGNQGYSQLVCFVGDFTRQPPTDLALDAAVRLLAALADRHGIDTREGATTSFVSRGSNRHRKGAVVNTRTIEGHRAMSFTNCPGDAADGVVRDTFQRRVSAVRGHRSSAVVSARAAAVSTSTTSEGAAGN